MADIQDFVNFALSNGFIINNPVFDGKIHRFKAKHKDSGWYVGYINETRSGNKWIYAEMADWAKGNFKYIYKTNLNNIDQSEITELHKKVERLQVEAEKQRRIDQKKSAEDAAIFISGCCNEDDAKEIKYLEKKKLNSKFGALSFKDDKGSVRLVIPMYDIDNNLLGYQKILDDKKLFAKGQSAKGGLFIIGSKENPTDNIYIAEGFATAATIHMATASTCIVAFSAGNLKEVATKIRSKFTDKKITICGDDDIYTEGNPGRTKALETGFACLFPVFKNTETKPKDFNDLYCLEGLEAVKEQIFNKKNESVFSKPQEKRNLYLLFLEVASTINYGNIGKKYYVTEPEYGIRKILMEHKKGTVCYVSEDCVVSDILNFTKNDHRFGFTYQNAKDAMKYWLYTAEIIKEPKIVKMKSEDGLCFHRLDFDPDPLIETPLFDLFLKRTSNSEALKCFIGSVFIEESDRQQYVWLYGQGMNGKGTLLRFLDKCLGISYFSTEPPTRDDKFWNYNLIGKRLVAFPDINNCYFPASQKFKMLSGGDKIPVEPKGKQAYNIQPTCKFIFASNERPEISSQKSDLRRSIFCEIGEIEKVESGFENKLWLEASGIIGKCIKTYKENCPENEPIEVEKDGLDLLASENAGVFEFIISKLFDIDPNIKSKNIDENKKYRISNSDFIDQLNTMKLQKNTVRGFKKYLEAKYEIKYKNFKPEFKLSPERAWIGIRKQVKTINTNVSEPTMDENVY